MPIFHTQVLSRDSVTVTVDAVVYYRVSNPTMATNNVEDFRYASHNGGPGTAVIRMNHPHVKYKKYPFSRGHEKG